MRASAFHRRDADDSKRTNDEFRHQAQDSDGVADQESANARDSRGNGESGRKRDGNKKTELLGYYFGRRRTETNAGSSLLHRRRENSKAILSHCRWPVVNRTNAQTRRDGYSQGSDLLHTQPQR